MHSCNYCMEMYFCLFCFVYFCCLLCGTCALTLWDGKNEAGYFMAILFLVE